MKIEFAVKDSTDSGQGFEREVVKSAVMRLHKDSLGVVLKINGSHVLRFTTEGQVLALAGAGRTVPFPTDDCGRLEVIKKAL